MGSSKEWYNNLIENANKQGKVLFLDDVPENGEIFKVCDKYGIPEEQEDALLEAAISWAEAACYEAFMTGFVVGVFDDKLDKISNSEILESVIKYEEQRKTAR